MPEGPDFWTGLPMGEPARRALRNAGLTSLEDLSTVTADYVASLHGLGPKALAVINHEMAEKGMDFT